ncbi:heterokaryon incompatibility protein-domain-containing protein [Cercophora samala]|uniref:Heterokaryon incompatibility protein-domain-containing protein n=1 Tax=Cercophora samala TaxID=330535 RepID=A0AA39ZI79_9PEZI|nr:heterokaryon incompatibility protein-domain-containing protein [Cercophora samala]
MLFSEYNVQTMPRQFSMPVNLDLIIFTESHIVIIAWATLLGIPLVLLCQVRSGLSDIWLDSSQLGLISTAMVVYFDICVERLLGDLFGGRHGVDYGRRVVGECTWIITLLCAASKPHFGRRYLGMQLLSILQRLYNMIDFRLTPRQPKIMPPSLAAAQPRYNYKPLSSDSAIRLITLQAQELMACSMEEVSLAAAPSFTALSYAWDSEHGTEPILCDGALIYVTKNCVAALRNIRSDKNANRRIWVDAICINQADTAKEEKGHQIAIMGDIYKKATRVRVWLGDSDRSSGLVCEYFEKVAGLGGHWQDNQTPEEVALDLARKWPRLTRSMVDFFSRSWFTRAWPVQEVTLPSPDLVEVVCGDAHLSLYSLRIGWHVLKELGVLPASASIDHAVSLQFYLADAIALKRGVEVHQARHYRTIRPISGTNAYQPLLTDLSQFSFTAVMNAMRFKSCQEAKDKFFSLYGVFKELEVDHGIPISMWTAATDAEVFKAVTLACFKLDRNLDAIRLAQQLDPYMRLSNNVVFHTRHNPYDLVFNSLFSMTRRVMVCGENLRAKRDKCHTSQTEGLITLPSWAPDWTQPLPARIASARHITLLDTLVSASGPESRNGTVRYAVDGQSMKVEAKILGRVEDIGTVNSAQLLWQILSVSINQDKTRLQKSVPDPILSALAETLTSLTWRSHIAQILVSLRMAFRTLGLFDVLAYASSAYTSYIYFTPRAFQFTCSWIPSVASCPCDGNRMRLVSGFKIEPWSEAHAISQAFGVFIKGRTWINQDMWRQSAGDVVFITGGVLWQFRVSILETLLGSRYQDIDTLLIFPLMGRLISEVTQEVTMFLGDTSLYLFAWSFRILAILGILVAFAVRLWKFVWFLKLPVLAAATALALRFLQDRSPIRVLASFFRTAGWFRESGSSGIYDAQGMHFFVTDTGFTGNTSGMLAMDHGDYLMQVRGCTTGDGYMIVRRTPNDDKKMSYRVVGAAYVGKGPLKEIQRSREAEWKELRLC